jgi:hypothetical protein
MDWTLRRSEAHGGEFSPDMPSRHHERKSFREIQDQEETDSSHHDCRLVSLPRPRELSELGFVAQTLPSRL